MGRFARAPGRGGAALLAAALGIALLAGGCASLADPRADLAATQKEFSRYLRWKEYAAASNFLRPEHAREFRERFAALAGLDITAVRGEIQDYREGAAEAETRLVVEYYHLPSVTLTSRELQLHWRYEGGGGVRPGRWVLAGPFPAFP